MNSNEFSIEPGVNDTGLNSAFLENSKFSFDEFERLLEKYDALIVDHNEQLNNLYNLFNQITSEEKQNEKR